MGTYTPSPYSYDEYIHPVFLMGSRWVHTPHHTYHTILPTSTYTPSFPWDQRLKPAAWVRQRREFTRNAGELLVRDVSFTRIPRAHTSRWSHSTCPRQVHTPRQIPIPLPHDRYIHPVIIEAGKRWVLTSLTRGHRPPVYHLMSLGCRHQSAQPLPPGLPSG